jgi:hypothetical protein
MQNYDLRFSQSGESLHEFFFLKLPTCQMIFKIPEKLPIGDSNRPLDQAFL